MWPRIFSACLTPLLRACRDLGPYGFSAALPASALFLARARKTLGGALALRLDAALDAWQSLPGFGGCLGCFGASGRLRRRCCFCTARFGCRSDPLAALAACTLCIGAACFVLQDRANARLGDETQIDLACIQVDTTDLYRHAVGQLIANAGALAAQLMARFVVLEVISTQLGDMHHAFDIQGIELHEDTERRHTGNGAGEFFAELVADEVALEPCFDVARSFVSAALVGRTVHAQGFPDRQAAFRLLLAVGAIQRLRLARGRRQHRIQHAGVDAFRLVTLAQ